MEQFIWVEKYRPQTVEECILPESIKSAFQAYVDDDTIPNLILSGKSGMGKTTVARAVADQLGRDVLIINASEQGNIDTLRVTVRQFASSMSFSGKPRLVVFDEADYLNQNSTQPALRGFIEEFSINCSFWFTCNYKDRLIDAIHSRCSNIEFVFPKEERASLAKQFAKRCETILQNESVEYDPKLVTQVILKHFPDFRRTLNALQGMVVAGKLSANSNGWATDYDANVAKLIPMLREKDMGSIRKWIGQNGDGDMRIYYRRVYDALYESALPTTLADAILIIARYQFQSAFSVDQEINLMACLIELAATCEFKK